jgi:SAM-dependent methyltransferase
VLEVGFGGGSVARWLAGRVGPAGRVVATDLAVEHLAGTDLPNLEVRRHDLLADPLEDGAYDLVHARALVEHLADPAAGLDRLLRAVRPGGALVVEDVDFGPDMVAVLSACVWRDGAPPLIEGVAGAIRAVFRAAGADPELGRRCPAGSPAPACATWPPRSTRRCPRRAYGSCGCPSSGCGSRSWPPVWLPTRRWTPCWLSPRIWTSGRRRWSW